MRPALLTTLAQERGTLTARATLAEPDVRLDADAADGAVLTIEEGGVRVDLAFPDAACVRLFQHRVGRLSLPEPRDP